MNERAIKQLVIPREMRLELQAFEDFCRADWRRAEARALEAKGMGHSADWIRMKAAGDREAGEAALVMAGRDPEWRGCFLPLDAEDVRQDV